MVTQLIAATCDLNPIELARPEIKKLVHESVITADMNLQKLLTSY
jgi:hypothetical protein